MLQVQLKEQDRFYGKMSFIDLAGSERALQVADPDGHQLQLVQD